MAKPDKRLARRPAPAPPALVTTSLARLEQEIGGREALVAALAHAPASTNTTYVLGILGDPAHARTPLASLCAMGGITAGELITLYREGELHRAQAVATRSIGEALPKVVADTMKRAAPYEEVCYVCQGLCQVIPEPSPEVPNPEPVDCPTCRATGRLLYAGDLEHKKLALELGKLTSKGGVNVQVNQQQNHYGGGAAGGALELLQAATDRILYGGGTALGDILEGEAEEVPPAAPGAHPPSGDLPGVEEDQY